MKEAQPAPGLSHVQAVGSNPRPRAAPAQGPAESARDGQEAQEAEVAWGRRAPAPMGKPPAVRPPGRVRARSSGGAGESPHRSPPHIWGPHQTSKNGPAMVSWKESSEGLVVVVVACAPRTLPGRGPATCRLPHGQGRGTALTGQQACLTRERPAGQPGNPGNVHFQTSTMAVCAVFLKGGPARGELVLWPVRGFTHPLDLALMPLCRGQQEGPRLQGGRPAPPFPPSHLPSLRLVVLHELLYEAHPSTRRLRLPLPTRTLSGEPSRGHNRS